MSYTKLSYSVRKFLRRKKAGIRRIAPDKAEAEKRIGELVAKLRQQYNKKSSA